MEEINGLARCEFVVFQKDSFMIAKFKALEDFDNMPEGSFSVKGDMAVKAGLEYTVHATLDSSNQKYKNSYNAIRVASDVDLSGASKSDIEKFLSEVSTPTRAKSIMATFDNPIEILENRDIEALVEAKGITASVASDIIDAYFSQKDYSEAIIEFQKYNLTTKTIINICKQFGSADLAIKMVNDNPYCLSALDGFGFTKADNVFLSDPENRPEDHRRVEAYIKFMFEREYDEGNTWISPADMIAKLKEFIPMADHKYAVEYVRDSEEFVVERVGEEIHISSREMYNVEVEIAQNLNRLMSARCNMNLSRYKESVRATEAVNGWEYDESQIQAIDNMADKNVYMLQGLAGTGKAMPKSIEIPTPDGLKKLGDIKVGDYVFDRLGKPTLVSGVYPQGMLDAYEVTLGDGRKTVCNDEHLWSYYTSKGNLKTVTLRQMIDKGLMDRAGYRYKIPVAEAVEYEKADLRIDPYVLGALIGDGACKERALTICSDDEFVVKEVSELIGAGGYKRNSLNNFSWTFNLKEPFLGESGIRYLFHTQDLLEYYPEVSTKAHEKRIPREFLYSSVEQRMSLVQGLLDTDGYILDSNRANVSYSSCSYGLIQDFKELLGSLGYQSTICIDERDGKRTGYSLNINIPNEEKHKLFRLPRRKDIALKYKDVKKNRWYHRVAISDIKNLNKKEDMVCIMVENEEHLFLANDFIVTHNTSVVKGFLNAVVAGGYQFSQCALSGKASNNLTISTGKQGYTIHSLLGASIGGFAYNENMPLQADVVVLDELSMVNMRIFLSLIKAIKSGAKLIMLGDYGQLEAIGVGVMGGLITSRCVPMSLLKKIHRQAQESAIITHSIAVRNGLVPSGLSLEVDESKVYGIRQDLEYTLVDKEDEDRIFDYSMDKFKLALNKYPIEDIQIICSTKTTGVVSTYELNKSAQYHYNPYKGTGEQVELGFNEHKYYLRVNDKVINMKNNKLTESPEGIERHIYNGNTGIVKDITVEGKNYSLIIDFDGIGEVVVEGKALNFIQLGYAITVHKSQGSTIKCVIFALPYHYLLNTKELVYTGMTRASEMQYIITSPRSFKRAIKNTSVKKKKINLARLIADELQKEKTA